MELCWLRLDLLGKIQLWIGKDGKTFKEWVKKGRDVARAKARG